MVQGRVIRVLCYYRDASILEMLVSTFRKLLIDINWFYGRVFDGSGLYEVYLGVSDSPNLFRAVLDLSTTVGVSSVEIFDNVDTTDYLSRDDGITKIVKIYIPTQSKCDCYSWGGKCG